MLRESGPTAAVQALSRLELSRWERSRLQASGRYVASADECGSSCMLGVSGEREGDSRKPSLAPLRLICICLASGLPLMPAIPALRCIVSTPPPPATTTTTTTPPPSEPRPPVVPPGVLQAPGEPRTLPPWRGGKMTAGGRPLVDDRWWAVEEREEENRRKKMAQPHPHPPPRPFSLLWLLSTPFSSSFGSQGHGCRDRL